MKIFLRTATTTKVVHKRGVLVEKIAYDLGARVSIKNLAWDAKSGQVLLKETINEYDDKYYSFNYPAYWYYKNMGMAADNIDMEGKLKETVNNGSFFYINGVDPYNSDIKQYFKIGDEVLLTSSNKKLWVCEYNSNHVKLMDKEGRVISPGDLTEELNFKVVRSGNKNIQIASMASVTSMKNPLANGASYINDSTFEYSDVNTTINKVINASVVQYSDIWDSQCENGLPNSLGLINGQGTPVNPFLYNTRGNWRAVKSYAYLTGRNNFITTNARKAGFFDDFSAFYKVNPTTRVWSIDSTKWTFASKVTRYSPYGIELENKDALNRYSAAQYGYEYTLPMAVASNSRYQEIGFDRFEDYNNYLIASPFQPHFGFSQALKTGVTVTNQKSHTGNNSLKVEAGQKATFTRKIDGCKQEQGDGCGAIVVATPLSENICTGGTTNIELWSPVPGTTFSWTIGTNSSTITGFSSGTGNTINQTLNNQSTSNSGFVNYIVTPTYNGCVGDPVSVNINVAKKINPVDFPSTATLYSNNGNYYAVYSAGISSPLNFRWDVHQNGILKYTGSYNGTQINISVPNGVNPYVGPLVYTIYQRVDNCTDEYVSTLTASLPQN